METNNASGLNIPVSVESPPSVQRRAIFRACPVLCVEDIVIFFNYIVEKHCYQLIGGTNFTVWGSINRDIVASQLLERACGFEVRNDFNK